MKKFNKAFLIALCALTTSFSVVACGKSSENSSTPGTSSEVSTGSSVEENSTTSAENSVEAPSSESSEESSVEENSSETSEDTSEENSSEDVADVFGVTINAEEGLTVAGDATATEGTSYTFTVSINTGYQKTDAYAINVTMGGETVTMVEDDGDYTIENVTGEIVIAVVGVEKKTFNVTKTETTGVTYEGADTVVFGENYTFKVNFANGYHAGESFAVSVNGKVITATADGEYVVENVKSGLVITVEGVEEAQYTATFVSDYADAIKNQQESFSYEADNYTFKIELSGKYTQCADLIEVCYKVEGSEEEISITPDADGVYSIANPKANLEIIVKNVELNQYKVIFMRNAVVKYEMMGTAGQALTEEQLNEALAELVGEDEEFVAWREDVTVEIMDKTTFSVVTKAKEAWGELIEGNPLKDGALQEGEYSAAGYETVYAKANFEAAPFAEIDISAYETVKFAFKHTTSWVLLDGWNYYLDTRNTWIDVTMEKMVTGEWNVVMEASVNHNYDGGMEVLNPYTVTLTGNTLAEIFASWYNDSNAANLFVSELCGEKAAFTKVVESAMSGATVAEGEIAPSGFTTVSERTIAAADKGSVFADVKIDSYKEVRFAFKSNSWMLFDGWAKYVHQPDKWVHVQLVNNFDNSWTVTVSGTSYTFTYSGTTVKEILKDWYNDAGTTFYTTELIGIQGEIPEVEIFGEVISSGVVLSDYLTLDETATAPEGFESVYAVNGIFNTDKKATADLSAYSEVRFAVKSTKYFLIKGWGVYFKESYTDWANVVMVNNGNGTWEVTIYADVFTASASLVENPYTITYTGNSIASLLAAWEGDETATTYVTELRGVKKEAAVWGDLVNDSVLTSDYVTLDETATAPNGFESVYAVKGVFNTDKKSTVDLSEYSEIRFAVKSTKYFLIKGWGVYFKESYTDWANVVMKNNGDGTWEVTIYADVFTGSAVANPYTVTCTGNSIATILAAWESDEYATVYVTEIRGAKA